MKDDKKIQEIKVNLKTEFDNQREGKPRKNKFISFSLGLIILLILLAVTTISVLYLMKSSIKLFSFLQTKVVVDISTVIKDIQQLERIVLFELSYEDVINVKNERVGEGFGIYYILKEGIYKYSGTALFGIDLSDFGETDVDKENKVIRIPQVKLLEVGLNSFDAWYENYGIEPKVGGLKLGYLDSTVPESIKNSVSSKYIYMAEQSFRENALGIFMNKEKELEKIGIEMFKKMLSAFVGEEGYRIVYRE